MTRVKICCIASEEEARLAIEAGASALGLVSKMPSGPGEIPEMEIARVASGVPPAVSPFLLTAHVDAAAIIRQQRRCGITTLQLVDRQCPETYAELRDTIPGVRLVQVVHVTGTEALDLAASVEGSVDAVLLDSGDPSAAVPTLGGTGMTHDWALSARIRERLSLPVFLAGGLRPENVAAAVAEVHPFAVDVCTGVRSDGRLDPGKLGAFMRAVRGADAA